MLPDFGDKLRSWNPPTQESVQARLKPLQPSKMVSTSLSFTCLYSLVHTKSLKLHVACDSFPAYFERMKELPCCTRQVGLSLPRETQASKGSPQCQSRSAVQRQAGGRRGICHSSRPLTSEPEVPLQMCPASLRNREH